MSSSFQANEDSINDLAELVSTSLAKQNQALQKALQGAILRSIHNLALKQYLGPALVALNIDQQKLQELINSRSMFKEIKTGLGK